MQWSRANFDQPEGTPVVNKPKKLCERCDHADINVENQVPVTTDRTTNLHCPPFKQDWWQLYDGTRVQPCSYYDR